LICPTSQSKGTLGATNANGWVYGLFELGVVMAFVLVVTLPFWADRFINWFQRLFDSAKQED
jgi:hypothetical protein